MTVQLAWFDYMRVNYEKKPVSSHVSFYRAMLLAWFTPFQPVLDSAFSIDCTRYKAAAAVTNLGSGV